MKSSTFFSVMGALVLAAGAGSAFAAIPDGYYNRLEGLSGVTLKKAVKSVARNHTVIPYGDDTWEVFLESDTHIVGSQRCWWDMYSNNNVAAPNASSHGGLNIEHSVANSWWGGTKNDAYKDIVHLNPSNSDANNRKSNYPLGIVASTSWENGVTFVGKPKSGTCGGASYVYEPADEYKGDFARVFFYMFTIYDDIAWMNSGDRNYMYDTSSDLLLRPWAYEMLLEWAAADPVSQKEIDRNNAIYKHQKNRNPFIDCPELAEHIWGSKKNSPFHLDGSTDPDPDPDPTPGPGTDPDPDPGFDVPSGYWYAVTSTADLNETDLYIIVATEAKCAMAADNAGKYFQISGKLPVFDSSVSPARISTVPSDAAVIRLTRNGTGWILGLNDMDGSQLGYLCSTAAKSLTITPQAGSNGTTATITPGSGKTDIDYGSKVGKLLYNAQAPRFLTYTSSQEPVQLYRLEEEKGGLTGIDGTGLDQNADETIIGIFDINGRRMSASDISELDSGIYIVVSNFGTKKIRK